MNTFSWTCPYCRQNAIITSNLVSKSEHSLAFNNKAMGIIFNTVAIKCPNSDCEQFTLNATLWSAVSGDKGWNYINVINDWALKPASTAKPYPDYIPEVIRKDYEEACLIADLSPKASATLSRRCLQGIVRDFWGETKNRLVDEINAIQGKVDPTTWQAIDAIRKVGNIGARMEKDINVIIDVEPEEAKLLIKLIEILLKDWYITRYEREKQLQAIIAIAQTKDASKNPPT